MKKLLLGSVALAAFAVSSAQAADLAPPVKAPPPVVTWSGCYVGGHVGGAWGTDKVSPVIADGGGAPFPRTRTIDSNTDVFGGGTFGCNYEALGFAVFGFEGDGGWMGLRGSVADLPHETHSLVSGGYGDITGRLGFAAGPVLFYGKGGGVFFDGHETTTTNVAGFSPFSTTIFGGWTAGGGVEWLFFPRWSVKAEYLYFAFGVRDSTVVAPGGTPIFPYANHLTANTVKVGINYHFY